MSLSPEILRGSVGEPGIKCFDDIEQIRSQCKLVIGDVQHLLMLPGFRVSRRTRDAAPAGST